METLLKADIFFFIASIGVILFTIALLVVVYYSVRLLQTISEISEMVRDEGKLIKDDIDSARDTIKANAEVVGTIIGAVAKSGLGKKATKRSSSKKK